MIETKTNKMFPLREMICNFTVEGEGDDYSLTCDYCGRAYTELHETEEASLRNHGCTASDCISHWEVQGLPHPEHTSVIYRYDDKSERAFLNFWKNFPEGKELSHNPIKQEEFFMRYIPTWNASVPFVCGNYFDSPVDVNPQPLTKEASVSIGSEYIDSKRSSLNVLEKPLSLEEAIGKARKNNGVLSGVVELELMTIVSTDTESWLNILCSLLVEQDRLMSVDYKIVGFEQDRLFIEVSGDATEIIEWAEGCGYTE